MGAEELREWRLSFFILSCVWDSGATNLRGAIRTVGTGHVRGPAKMPRAVLRVCSSHTVFSDLILEQALTLLRKWFLFPIEMECYQQVTENVMTFAMKEWMSSVCCWVRFPQKVVLLLASAKDLLGVNSECEGLIYGRFSAVSRGRCLVRQSFSFISGKKLLRWLGRDTALLTPTWMVLCVVCYLQRPYFSFPANLNIDFLHLVLMPLALMAIQLMFWEKENLLPLKGRPLCYKIEWKEKSCYWFLNY